MKFTLTHLVFAAVLFHTAGCVTVEKPVKKEPAIIAVRNLGYADISQVHLSAVPKQQNAATRFGSVSPVLRGVTQSVVRARNAPALPAEMLVRWTDKNGKEYRQLIKLQPLIEKSTGREDEVLLFVIQPDHRVDVILDYMHR